MLRSILIGLVAGQRAIAPLAAVAVGTLEKRMPINVPLQGLFRNPLVTGAVSALAAVEMAGDKMKSAPDRIVPTGLVARAITSTFAGAALAAKGQRALGGGLAMGTALISSYIGWRLRCAAMVRHGQTSTGLIEDALVTAGALLATRRAG